MRDELTAWEAATGRILTRWFVFIPLIVALSILLYGMSLDDFPVPVVFVHFFPFSLSALADQVWNGLWNFCRPTAMLLWRLEYALFDGNYVGHRLTMLLLHILNVYLVFLVGRRLLKNDIAAAISGLLFATHPIHSENVCLLASQYDMSCMTFFLAAMLAYDRYLVASDEGVRTRVRLWAILACLFELLSIGGKEVGVMLPFVLIAYDLCRKMTRRNIGGALAKALWRGLPVLAVLAAYAVFRVARYEQNIGYAAAYLNQPIETLLRLGTYLRLLLSPNIIWLLLLAVLPFAKKEYIFALLFVLITLLPVLQMPPMERFCYIPSAGYCLATGWAFVIGIRRVASWLGRLGPIRRLAWVGSALGLALAIVQIPFAYQNSQTWSAYLPVRKTLKSIRRVVPKPGPGTTFYFANIEPLFDLALLNDYDYSGQGSFRCEKIINYVYEQHSGPEYFFEMIGDQAFGSEFLRFRCKQLLRRIGPQRYGRPDIVWGRGGRPLSQWTIDGRPAVGKQPGDSAAIALRLGERPVVLASPPLTLRSFEVSSVTLKIDPRKLSPHSTCQIEWSVVGRPQTHSTPPAVIPISRPAEQPSIPMSAPPWERNGQPSAKVQIDQITIDLGSRTDWVFQEGLIDRIAVRLKGSGTLIITGVRLNSPRPTKSPGLAPIIQFHERRQ